MSNIAVRAQNLSKAYKIGALASSKNNLREVLTDLIIAPAKKASQLLHGQHYGAAALTQTIWALKDVSFEIERGTVVGIIGHNGAGKSTLLRILSRITQPTSGYIELYGRVGALLEVGTGFHHELTGRENIYLNGSILGMKQRDIHRKFDEIVAFAGVETFLDTPVKHYSSGMRVRLGFSVAAHLEPDILMVDEVLSVGDAEFQKKCLGKMEAVSSEGRTVLFVSHNMAAIASLCTRAMQLTNGQINHIGPTREVIARYLGSHVSRVSLEDVKNRSGSGVLRFTSWWISDEQLGVGDQVTCGERCSFHLAYETSLPFAARKNIDVSITITDIYGQAVVSGVSSLLNTTFDHVADNGTFVCHFETLPLLPGTYHVYLWSAVGTETADLIPNAGAFTVVAADVYGTGRFPQRQHGVMVLPHKWEYGE